MEFRERKSIYLQIADIIIERIINGIWGEEQRIPSVREMATEMQVNPNTVVRSYNYLQSLGIIYNRRGIGYFISFDARKKALEIKRKEFTREKLPEIFKEMTLLKIPIYEFEELYKRYISKDNI
ncbi:MAG: GntR family transcriptional regulator [Spirochaetes bacterium]|nr:MAG: GntR family transcriptional regulator [Spirochaetota bacterium]